MCSVCVGLVCVATNDGHAILQGPYSQAQINIDLTFDCFVIEESLYLFNQTKINK